MKNFIESIDQKFQNDTISLKITKEEIGLSIVNSQYKMLIANVLLANLSNDLLAKLYSASNGYLKMCPFKVGDVVILKNTRCVHDFKQKKDVWTEVYVQITGIDELKENIEYSFYKRLSSGKIELSTENIDKFEKFNACDLSEYHQQINDPFQSYESSINVLSAE